MTRFLPDTSVMIAATCSWHGHHQPAADEFERRLRSGDTLIVAGPALVEAYAVLTRLPAPHRISPSDARTLLEANFLRRSRIVALDARDYRGLLNTARALGISGGRTYDWVIASCAAKANISILLTLNARDYESFALEHMEVRVPGKKKP